MIRAYRMLSEKVDYPLHLGVTEAGTVFAGSIKSAVGIGTLLAEGIGDTIRVSLSADPVVQGLDAVAQHRAALGVEHRERQASVFVLGGGDAVAAVLGEELRPVFQPAFVESVSIAGVKALHRLLKIHAL